jgi:hypothetical protein
MCRCYTDIMFSLIALITYLHLLIYIESNGNSQDDAATSDTTREIAAVVAEYPNNPDATAGDAGVSAAGAGVSAADAGVSAADAAIAAALKESEPTATMEIIGAGVILL